LDLVAVLEQLSKKRPVFHSEADFQHAIAWAIHEAHGTAAVRLEVPLDGRSSRQALDLLVYLDGKSSAVELKYKTRKLSIQAEGELFGLKDQSAQDLGRYDFFRDLARIEGICAANTGWSGWAVFLTNDSSYWKSPGRAGVAYEEFRMDEDRVVGGALNWGPTAGPGTTKDRKEPIILSRNYRLRWNDYSSLDTRGYSRFRYLALATDQVDGAAP
jgi:hypothetical protein